MNVNAGKIVMTFGGVHDSTLPYERLTQVKTDTGVYLSKVDVPENIEITNETYWSLQYSLVGDENVAFKVAEAINDDEAINKGYFNSHSAGFKNLLINGGFDVWQRGTTSTTSGYLADRWNSVLHQTDGSITAKRVDITSDYLLGFKYALAYEGGDVDPYIHQSIEGQFAGRTVTLSFYIKGGVPEIVRITDNAGVMVSLSAIEIETIGTWKRYKATFNIPKTPPTLDYIRVRIDMQEDLVEAQAITGIQLEEGDEVTAFEYRHYALELDLCKRYWQTVPVGGTVSSANSGNTIAKFNVVLEKTMRTTPTVFYSGESLLFRENLHDEIIDSIALTNVFNSSIMQINGNMLNDRGNGVSGTVWVNGTGLFTFDSEL